MRFQGSDSLSFVQIHKSKCRKATFNVTRQSNFQNQVQWTSVNGSRERALKADSHVSGCRIRSESGL